MKYTVTRVQCELNNGKVVTPNNIIEEERLFDSAEALEQFRKSLKDDLNTVLSLFDDWKVEHIFFTYKEVNNEESK